MGCNQDAGDAGDVLEFDQDGEVLIPFEPYRPGRFTSLTRPCALSALDGSWLIEVERRTIIQPLVRGPMRIEVGASSLRVSGDIYSQRIFGPIEPELVRPPFEPFPPLPPLQPRIPGLGDEGEGADAANEADEDFGVLSPIPLPWYPSFPQGQYSWYFRSNGATYADGVLTVQIVRHLWNRSTQEFTTTDTGTLTLTCRRSLITARHAPQVMTGTLRIGGTTSQVKATKTSSMYRGCRIEVDAMVNRNFPASAVAGSGATVTLRSVYATAGWDVSVVQDQVNVPSDASLTNAELQTLLSSHRQAVSGEQWRLWLLVGSAQGGLFGIMFDDDTVPREGAVGFADATLGNQTFIEAGARNQPLNNVPAAFLRTLIHEAGHAFNLFHPKHDVHLPGIGTEIMNQTGDVMGFASSSNTYPGNATFAFSEHDRLSLIHSPDPQVRPGWKNFGWGHGSLSSGLPTPVDVSGFSGDSLDTGLRLQLVVAPQAFVGEYVTAEVIVTNTGDAPRQVTSLLTLAEGDLVFERTRPDGSVDHVLDIVIGCGPRPMVTLQPGESVSNHVQVFFTNQGVTFTEPGRHTIAAILAADALTTLTSDPATIDVRTPASDTEVAISAQTLDHGVGRAMALGDFGADVHARKVLTALAEEHADTDTGAAGALVMANALSREFADIAGDTVRAVATDEAQHFLDLALQGRSAKRAAELAVTVASPTEKDAPVVADVAERIRKDAKGGARSASGRAAAEAERIVADFIDPQAR
ncbi:hypothetical protein Q9S36_10240 [Microbacterium sp. ARD31]|uniref:hypothetical protein n=1 Tax=Microbacterium sp. ARD31 TaxID=2962576 RepID=UPI002881734F|nr:hypothetical protein [Microbacterium sp. ARD31]MDT0180579.1 hypothetical protein [Microbacterium sp. ARD31]